MTVRGTVIFIKRLEIGTADRQFFYTQKSGGQSFLLEVWKLELR